MLRESRDALSADDLLQKTGFCPLPGSALRDALATNEKVEITADGYFLYKVHHPGISSGISSGHGSGTGRPASEKRDRDMCRLEKSMTGSSCPLTCNVEYWCGLSYENLLRYVFLW
jgi:hypothetical protein